MLAEFCVQWNFRVWLAIQTRFFLKYSFIHFSSFFNISHFSYIITIFSLLCPFLLLFSFVSSFFSFGILLFFLFCFPLFLFFVQIQTCCQQWHDHARCTYMHIWFQSTVLLECSICSYPHWVITDCARSATAQEKVSRHVVTQSHNISSLLFLSFSFLKRFSRYPRFSMFACSFFKKCFSLFLLHFSLYFCCLSCFCFFIFLSFLPFLKKVVTFFLLFEPLWCGCTVGHITACCSRHDNDFHVIHRRLGPKSNIVKIARIIHSAQRTFAHCVSFPTLTSFLFSFFFICFSHAKTLVGVATVTRVTFDLPECKEPQRTSNNQKKLKIKSRKQNEKMKKSKNAKMKKTKGKTLTPGPWMSHSALQASH